MDNFNNKDKKIKETLAQDKFITDSNKNVINNYIPNEQIKPKKISQAQKSLFIFILIILLLAIAFVLYLYENSSDSDLADSPKEFEESISLVDKTYNGTNTVANLPANETTNNSNTVNNIPSDTLNLEDFRDFLNSYAYAINRLTNLNNDELEKNTIYIYIAMKYFDSQSIKTASLDCKKEIAYIPDNPDIYEHLRGIDYINFIASVFKIPHQKKIELTQRYSEMFEMSQYLNQSISNYSHGMKQKISLIAALIHEPQVLILDEPFVGLDPISTHKLKEEMQRLASNGATILFSTHILDVAEKLCNKIAILKEGKLIYSGKMSELIQNKSLEEIYMEMDNNVELI